METENNQTALKRGIEKIRGTFWLFFVNNWKLTAPLLVFITLFGAYSLMNLTIESQPEVKIPIGVVTTTYPGASPEDVEKLVTDKLENKINSMEDLDTISSSSSEGMSSITVRFDTSADIDNSISDLRDEVDAAKIDLPADANDPIIMEISITDTPIITFSLLGNLTKEKMKIYADDIQDIIEGVNGVSEVNISGIEEKEFQVIIKPEKLQGYGLTISSITNAIRNNHVDSPIGQILTNNFYYQISLKGQLATEEEILNLPVATTGGQNIFIRDIAEVRKIFAENTSTSRMYLPEEKEYLSSITLQVKKNSSASISDVAAEAKELVAEYSDKNLPSQVQIIITSDESIEILEDLSTLGSSAVQTVILIFIVLFLALGLKEAIMVGLSVPLIFCISAIWLSFAGETLNSLTIFGLILSLGIMVDTSIVVMEGIYENMEKRKMSPYDSILGSLATYKGSLISGTLTTVFVFSPMMFLNSTMGDFIKHIPITVNITLLSSLFVALMLLTAIANYAFRNHDHNKPSKKPYFSYLVDPLRVWYVRYLRSVISSKLRRRAWVFIMLIAFIVTISFPFTGILKIELMAKTDANTLTVNVEMPEGTSLSETNGIITKIETIAENIPELESLVTIIGSSGKDEGTVDINLVSSNERTRKSYEIANDFREQIAHIKEAKIQVLEKSSTPSGGSAISVRAVGNNANDAKSAATKIEKALSNIDGAINIKTDSENATGEYHIELKRDQLNHYGITANSIAGELRTFVLGDDSIDVLEDGEEIPIAISLDFRDEKCVKNPINQIQEIQEGEMVCLNYPDNISQIKNLLISTNEGFVPVSELADITLNSSVSSMNHYDLDNVVTVSSDVADGYLSSDITTELQKQIEKMEMPEGVNIEFGGDAEEMIESFSELGIAMVVGVFAIFMLLIYQFKSYTQPLTIVISIPLALIGVFTGLALLGCNFSMAGFIGIIALAGIVVNDAIVLIDSINVKRSEGVSKKEAIIETGGERLQPILITTITTAIGVIPLIFADETWKDLALTIAIGVSFSTLLTLIMIPIFYNFFEKEEN